MYFRRKLSRGSKDNKVVDSFLILSIYIYFFFSVICFDGLGKEENKSYKEESGSIDAN